MKNRILLVDDEPDTLELMEELFEGKGYIADTATNGIEAIEKVKQNEPDIILSDIRMPQMDGMQLLQVLNKDFPRAGFDLKLVNLEAILKKAAPSAVIEAFF